jgi:GNAT superfamily N-acetyltransferase
MTSPAFTIEELEIPTGPDHPAYAAFDASVAMRNAIEAEAVGSWALAVTTDELLPVYQDTTYEPHRLWLAWVDGEVAGRGMLSWTLVEESPAAWIFFEVALPHRNKGIGSALMEIVEREAKALGKTIVQGGATHTRATGGEDLVPPTGYGKVNTADPGARFLHHRGYALEQIARCSIITLPADADLLARSRAAAEEKAGPDYRVHTWEGPTPPEWLFDIARLKEQMSEDEPNAGLEVTPEVWDDARVQKHDEDAAAGGRVLLTSVVEHIPSGRLAGINELSVPADLSRAVGQEDTLVVRDHRGKRLGMLLKAANLQELAIRYPEAPLVYTFNAEENRFMLDVNESVGFVPTAYDGLWKKTLA